MILLPTLDPPSLGPSGDGPAGFGESKATAGPVITTRTPTQGEADDSTSRLGCAGGHTAAMNPCDGADNRKVGPNVPEASPPKEKDGRGEPCAPTDLHGCHPGCAPSTAAGQPRTVRLTPRGHAYLAVCAVLDGWTDEQRVALNRAGYGLVRP